MGSVAWGPSALIKRKVCDADRDGPVRRKTQQTTRDRRCTRRGDSYRGSLAALEQLFVARWFAEVCPSTRYAPAVHLVAHESFLYFQSRKSHRKTARKLFSLKINFEAVKIASRKSSFHMNFTGFQR